MKWSARPWKRPLADSKVISKSSLIRFFLFSIFITLKFQRIFFIFFLFSYFFIWLRSRKWIFKCNFSTSSSSSAKIFWFHNLQRHFIFFKPASGGTEPETFVCVMSEFLLGLQLWAVLLCPPSSTYSVSPEAVCIRTERFQFSS